MNPFMRVGDYERLSTPERLYARLDQIEPLSYGQQGNAVQPDSARQPLYAMFDCVDATWFDRNEREAMGDEEYFARIRISVLAVKLSPKADPRAGILNNISNENDEVDASDWFEIYISQNAGGLPAELYQNLYTGDPAMVQIDRVNPISKDIMLRLESDFSLDEEDDAEEAEIKNAIFLSRKVDFCAVYDVGQGNCNGLCAVNGAPLAYYDFGGGVLGNAGTFPLNLQSFCYNYNPPIILSHWDWDHWSSANRDPRAMRQTWIVPRQKLGAVHRTFAANVKTQGSLLVWPSRGLPSVSAGQITIEKCIGTGRNHSGLAVIVSGPNPFSSNYMLFPGDARYNVIPSYMSHSYTAVVAPHHGADMRNRYTPPCPGRQHDRLAYSYGAGNTFKHAKDITRRDHDKNGWRDRKINAAIPLDLVRQTEVRSNASGLGHIMLRWSPGRAPRHMPCHGAGCQLVMQQS